MERAQTKKIPEEAMTLNVSRMLSRLHTHATYVEDAEFVSRKQKYFVLFLFAHPSNIVSDMNKNVSASMFLVCAGLYASMVLLVERQGAFCRKSVL